MTPTKPQNEPCSPVCPQGDCANCVDFPLSTRQQANDVLDAVRIGLNIERDRIDWALRVTGDLTDQPARTGAHLGVSA